MPTLLTLVPNLLFGVGIQNAAHAAGLRVRACRDLAAFRAALAEADPPLGAVVDLGGPDPSGWTAAIQAAAAAGVPVFAFGPHLDSTALRGARRAGASRVVANSALAAALPKWLDRQLTATPGADPAEGDSDAG